jgi:uroporphyrinogen III methyltransferase / synthase
VTSAIAVPAYAGIPLTHREHTSTVAFITGHEDPTKETSDIAWDKLATGAGTLVFLMGVGNLEKIAFRLMEHGRAPETPVAVIRMGTVPGQRTVTGISREIAQIAEREKIRPPAVIVVGDVVHLRKELNWFEKKPLFGKRIIVTRAREQASEFLSALCEMGAECLEFPTIKVVPPESWEDLDRSIRRPETYHWLVFTSVNGVKYFLDRLEILGGDVRDLKGVKIAAIGPATAEAVRSKGMRIDLVPGEYRAEAVVEAFRKEDIEGRRILLPRAREAREILPQELETWARSWMWWKPTGRSNRRKTGKPSWKCSGRARSTWSPSPAPPP